MDPNTVKLSPCPVTSADRIGAMMTKQKIAGEQGINDSIAFAAMPDNIVVVRITGRGSFHNSMELRRLADVMFSRAGGEATRYLIDLADCVTMDSTFMGVLASIGLKQLRAAGEKLAVLNANEQNVRLLSTLGLSQFIVVREATETGHGLSDDEFQCLLKEDASRRERIIHMIEAHRDLCEADPSNNLRFESVLKYLTDSLEHEK
jgi:anti-sigma B factor antagonist